MAATTEASSTEPEGGEGSSSFEWDEQSQLYYHASTGFYHDPSAGWYYNGNDGLYYKFENGNYVLLESNEGDQAEKFQNADDFHDSSGQDDPSAQTEMYGHVNNLQSGATGDDLIFDARCNKNMDYLSQGNEYETRNLETGVGEPPTVTATHSECSSSQIPECPPPPSEWLEETLINLYLSGYSNQETDGVHDGRMSADIDKGDSTAMLVDGCEETHDLEEGEWIPEEDHNINYSSEVPSDEGALWNEESWQAQYGQVIHSDEKLIPDFRVVDLWDWSTVTGTKRKGKGLAVRLVGHLVRQSARLHPSMPSGGGLFKTAPISEVQLDFVRVTSGQVYKLRNPSARYLASLSTYDSSNPTKDWDFPELSVDKMLPTLSKSGGGYERIHKNIPLSGQPCLSKISGGSAYRDRAAERRALHGDFGVGPGQKRSAADSDDYEPPSLSTEEAADEALNMSFGAGSYARKILEGMGWKEGDALGSSSSKGGLLEPIQAVGNKGQAGLGWDHTRR